MRADIKLYNEDCLKAMKAMQDNQFDLAIVDPPYGIKRDGHNGVKAKNPNHNWKKHKFKGWDNKRPIDKYWHELFRVSKNQIVFGGNYFTKHLPQTMGWIVWDKGQRLTMSDGELIFTSFNKALRIHELNRGWVVNDGGVMHPTQKPSKLYKWILDHYANKGDKILDTHLGSGSIAIACWDMGFDLTGYEIDKEYYDAACKRLKMHQAQLQIF